MEELAFRVRTFVYTMICFQCLLQLSVGNSFYKYLKFFTQLLAFCVCCNIFLSFFELMDNGWEQADRIYEQWQEQWQDKELFSDEGAYLENQITKESVIVFEQQIVKLLQEKGHNRYELEELSWHKEQWELVIRGTGVQEDKGFAEEFKQSVCQEFAIKEEQVEVKMR